MKLHTRATGIMVIQQSPSPVRFRGYSKVCCFCGIRHREMIPVEIQSSGFTTTGYTNAQCWKRISGFAPMDGVTRRVVE